MKSLKNILIFLAVLIAGSAVLSFIALGLYIVLPFVWSAIKIIFWPALFVAVGFIAWYYEGKVAKRHREQAIRNRPANFGQKI